MDANAKFSTDPATQQYNDQVEQALNSARNARDTWSAHRAVTTAQHTSAGANPMTSSVHQAEAMAFVADIWIDGLDAMIKKLEGGVKGKSRSTLGKPEHAEELAKQNIAAEKAKAADPPHDAAKQNAAAAEAAHKDLEGKVNDPKAKPEQKPEQKPETAKPAPAKP